MQAGRRNEYQSGVVCQMDNNVLDRKWSALSLLSFALPTIFMMMFMGLYTIVDTIFVAQFVNTDALSAINIVSPVINLTVGIGTMIGTGGNAIISYKIGAGWNKEAKEDLTLLVSVAAGLGFVVLIAGTIWIDKIIYALGASNQLFPYCKDYLGMLFLFIPANVIQTVFTNLFVTAGKPGMGLGLLVSAGLANIVLDYVFIAVCGLGIRGAAIGTGCGYLIPTVVGLAFFVRGRETLCFTKPIWKWKVLKESCLNGSSEMVGQLSSAVTTFLFNITMMKLLGENGVAAITILIFSQFLFNSLYIGFSIGVAPVIGFNYGKRNKVQQKNVFQICIRFIFTVSILLFTVSWLGGSYIIQLFTSDSSEVYELAAGGFRIFAFGFLFSGFNLFISSMFTALSNGKVSAILSFLRTFGLLVGCILLLPQIWKVTGVWLAVPIAEGIMSCISVIFLLHYKGKYM